MPDGVELTCTLDFNRIKLDLTFWSNKMFKKSLVITLVILSPILGGNAWAAKVTFKPVGTPVPTAPNLQNGTPSVPSDPTPPALSEAAQAGTTVDTSAGVCKGASVSPC